MESVVVGSSVVPWIYYLGSNWIDLAFRDTMSLDVKTKANDSSQGTKNDQRSYFSCELQKSIVMRWPLSLQAAVLPVVWMVVGALLLYSYTLLWGYDVQHGSFKSMDEIYHSYQYLEGFDHYFNYAKAYDDNLSALRKRILVDDGRRVKLLEIGVQSGGSINVWTEFFNGKMDYIGIDINPKCTMFANPEMRRIVEIGSQRDPQFLKSICVRYGPFDVVIDDGSHLTADILTSLFHLWGCLNDKAVYAIEDLHSMSLLKGLDGMLVQGRDFYDVLGRILRRTSSYCNDIKSFESQNFPPHDKFSGHIRELRHYDSLSFFHFSLSPMPQLRRFKKGSQWIPYLR